MTADLDLSPEAVERLARSMELIAERSGFNAADWLKGAATLRALAAENARLLAEDKASAHDIARLKDSETHWLNEADRLQTERDAAWQAGAEEDDPTRELLPNRDYERGQWRSLDRVLALLNTYDCKEVPKKRLYHDVMDLRPVSAADPYRVADAIQEAIR